MTLTLAALLATTLAGPPVEVGVSRVGETFTAEFRLPRSAPAWGFFRSATARVGGQPWRPVSWTVLTPGVRLIHRGRYDALVGADGKTVPRTVRIRIAPFTGDLISDYVPALRLGADGIALFDVPAAIERDGMTTVVDMTMPPWLADDVRSFTPRVLARYRRQLGPAGALKPTVLASWTGAERPGLSLNGGVLKGLVLMRLSGRQATTPNPSVRSAAHRFIAHESAHFWLGQALEYQRTADSWIMEGGADLLAIRTLAAEEPAFDARAALQRSLAGCLAATRRGALASAGERGDPEPWYDCGAVLSLVAERVTGGDFGTFVRRMIAANPDGRISTAEWLGLLDRAAPGRNLARRALPLIEQPQANAVGWTALLGAAGIRFRLRPDRTPELL